MSFNRNRGTGEYQSTVDTTGARTSVCSANQTRERCCALGHRCCPERSVGSVGLARGKDNTHGA